ncbi:ABC transporter substrate-binding protein [Sporichthya polymorpha]|uniref:ABC transporter substrate-binding protein n=1 Tax=Sporichthya polymorpha TaxID=35751 RepID=UPI0003A06C88|nr:ABC transporter substrate-binding protein [Sporichthya polymorpha]
MSRRSRRPRFAVLPIAVSAALVLTACGGGSDSGDATAQTDPAAVADAAGAPAGAAAAPVEGAAPVGAPGEAPAGTAPVGAAPVDGAAPVAGGAAAPTAKKGKAAKGAGGAAAVGKASTVSGVTSIDNAAQAAENERIAAAKNGATDIGVTKDSIKLGTVSAHGIALGNLLVTPMVNGIKAAFASINDRGGVLGRRLSLVDCDDGPGEVSRSKACLKKLAGQDKIFALLSYSSWASASIHSDLAQYKLPAVGTWAYSQTEWQDPYMFPTHMSMIHEAMANAHWVKNVIQPKTYGLVCLTSPEMQLSCNEVQRVLDASGSKMVKKLDVAITETSMSAQILSLRAAQPEHVVHYVINPATMAKFMVEATQQNYYPPKGISGNHLAAEVLGSLFGKHPVNRYWTNTTYKLWGPEFMATMAKYARGNKGLNHHIVQANYVGSLIFERAAKAVGPNLTRERLMAQLGNGDVYASDASLDQRFSWSKAERGGSYDNQTWSKEMGQGREYMYKYTSTNTVADPNGAPSGFQPDPDQFVIYTHK